MKSNAKGYAFISPWIIGMLVFTAFPVIASVWLSFCSYDIVSAPHWIGLANYHALFANDHRFWLSLWNTLRYAIVALPLGLIVSFLLALLLNLDVPGISVFRTIFFLPNIVPVVASAVIFQWILNPQIGLLNNLMHLLTGIPLEQLPGWLTSETWSMWSLVMMSVWTIGASMIIYLAGLKDIPVSLYEAAVVDGANAWQKTVHITIPLMTPVIFFNLVIGLIETFQYFTQAYVMTQGGPANSTLFYALYLFYQAWKYLNIGEASAMAWILFVIITVSTVLIFRSQKKWVHYDR